MKQESQNNIRAEGILRDFGVGTEELTSAPAEERLETLHFKKCKAARKQNL